MKDLRDFLEVDLIVEEEVSPELEAAKILMNNCEKTVLFKSIEGSELRAVGNSITSRERMCSALGTTREKFIPIVIEALKDPIEPETANYAPCQERELDSLFELPVLRYFAGDAGRYITSGVVFAEDEEHGRNASVHRLLLLDDSHLAIRLVERHLHTYYHKREARGEPLKVAIAIGLHPSILFAASYSFNGFQDELALAGALAGEPVPLAEGRSVSIRVPSQAEIVIEGKLLPHRRAKEGPFTDITGTYDIAREQPVVEVTRITAREDALYHILVPSSTEHRLLMGMPREPSIYNEVSKVARVRNVALTEGGCSWLHGVVAIEKERSGDAERAIQTAFRAHKSMKHVAVVDRDIDIFNPLDVEFALATRFQAHRDAYVYSGQKGSSLDPSAENSITTKVGLDATVPLGKAKDYETASMTEVKG